MTLVGVIANPYAGKDIRRVVSYASTSTDTHKIDIIRRAIIGAVDGGADRIMLMPDRHLLSQRGISDVEIDADVSMLDMRVTGERTDSTRAAEHFREMGAGAVIVLGGDGTARDVARGWLDAPMMALSTGTNNVFPVSVEPTVAGTAAGLVASGQVPLVSATVRSKAIHVWIGDDHDIALVDLAVVAGDYVGSRAVWDPETVRHAIVAIADPASIGLSSIAGRVRPCRRLDNRAVLVSLDRRSNDRVIAPIVPGSAEDVGIADVDELQLEQRVEIDGPGLLAFDGERDRRLDREQTAIVTVRRDGPRVIDSERTLSAAADRGLFWFRPAAGEERR